MTKKKKDSSIQGQMSLFEILKETMQQQTKNAIASLCITSQVKTAMSEDLRHAIDERGIEISRAHVAASMTDLLGEEITLSMLNNWTATSHPHEMPLSYLPAFIRATGGQRRTAELISKYAGLFLLPGPEALRAEIQRIDESMQKMKIEKQKRLMFLKELEGK